MTLYLCLPLLAMLLKPVCLYTCSSEYERTPDNSDLSVDCGTSMIILEVNLCTAQWSGFNISDLALNGNHNTTDCLGYIDSNVNPPVIRYELPVNHSMNNPCRQSLQIVDEAPDPSGPFSSFSSIQSVIITGYIDTPRADQGVISYSTDLYYHFSCRYPLEYLVNNTEIVASSVSVATSDNNGTFIDTLKMAVFNDSDYMYPLTVPSTGLQLRTMVYVEVKAVNLTGNCTMTERTTVTSNGISKVARFNFEAFRFVQHRDQPRSSIYLHCIMRLCEPTKCQELLNSCQGRRKRSLAPFGKESTDSATVSAGPLYMAGEDGDREQETDDLNVTGLVVGLVFGSAAAAMLVLGGWCVLKKYALTGGLFHGFD
ncbi:Zona pellucida-like domain-containing protein 1 [Collichthys lucidus]|uniref:Zona pellucida-like domain-containing protein 1 n=1 Tax=Collichthys lucidus TaxID=240159 RepID=A0A4U5V3X2_COLLU|nr:Zona pellucida-like domain-containing protein 1 [Collichthys lucidus]